MYFPLLNYSTILDVLVACLFELESNRRPSGY